MSFTPLQPSGTAYMRDSDAALSLKQAVQTKPAVWLEGYMTR